MVVLRGLSLLPFLKAGSAGGNQGVPAKDVGFGEFGRPNTSKNLSRVKALKGCRGDKP